MVKVAVCADLYGCTPKLKHWCHEKTRGNVKPARFIASTVEQLGHRQQCGRTR